MKYINLNKNFYLAHQPGLKKKHLLLRLGTFIISLRHWSRFDVSLAFFVSSKITFDPDMIEV